MNDYLIHAYSFATTRESARHDILFLMTKRTVPLIIGNWKTTPATKLEAIKFIKALDKKISKSEVKLAKKAYYIAAPDIFIPSLNEIATNGYIGAQNISGESIGQVTGATVPSMLATGGALFAIVGHSEVRAQGETKEARARKAALSLQSKLMTVLCVGEHTRDKQGNYLAELEEDIKDSLSLVDRNLFEYLVIAYEPVWAIGGKTPATPYECFEVVIALRRALATLAGIEYAKKVHIIYGGTVTPANAKSFMDEGGVDGLLIGRASQNVDEFSEIIFSCSRK